MDEARRHADPHAVVVAALLKRLAGGEALACSPFELAEWFRLTWVSVRCDLEEAILLAQRLQLFCARHGYQARFIEALVIEGHCLGVLACGRSDSGLAELERANVLAAELKESWPLTLATCRIATYWSRSGAPQVAIDHLNAALQAMATTPSPEELHEVNMAFGILFHSAGRYRDALKYWIECWRHWSLHSDITGQAIMGANMAAGLTVSGRYAVCERLLKGLLNDPSLPQRSFCRMMVSIRMAQLCVVQRRFVDGLHWVRTALSGNVTSPIHQAQARQIERACEDALLSASTVDFSPGLQASSHVLSAHPRNAFDEPFQVRALQGSLQILASMAAVARSESQRAFFESSIARQGETLARLKVPDIFSALGLGSRRGMALPTFSPGSDAYLVKYQPIVELPQLRVVGCEALLRYRDPSEGEILPYHFLPQLEREGAILGVGRGVIVRTVEDLKAWQDDGRKATWVAINLSDQQLEDLSLAEFVLNQLAAHDLAPSNVRFEIGPDLPTRGTKAEAGLNLLASHGFHIVLDGVGLAPVVRDDLLAYNLGALKLDGALCRAPRTEAEVDRRDNLLAWIETRGLPVHGKWIESASDMVAMARLGLREIQGSFFKPPVNVDEMASLWGHELVMS